MIRVAAVWALVMGWLAAPNATRAQPVEVPYWIDGAPCMGRLSDSRHAYDVRRSAFRLDGRPVQTPRYISGFGPDGDGWCAVVPPPTAPGAHTLHFEGSARSLDWLEVGRIVAGEERCFAVRDSPEAYPIEGLVYRTTAEQLCVTAPWTSTIADEVNATLWSRGYGEDEGPTTRGVLRARIEGAPVRLVVWHLAWILVAAVAMTRARRGRPRATWVVSFVAPESVTFRDKAGADWSIARLERSARALAQTGLRLARRFGVEGIVAPQPVMWTDAMGRPRRSRFVPLIAGGGLHDGTKPMLFFDDASAAEIRAGRVVLTLPTPEALGTLRERAPRRETWPFVGFVGTLVLSVGTAALLTHLCSLGWVYAARTGSGMAIAAALNVIAIALACVAIRPDAVPDPLAAWRRDRV